MKNMLALAGHRHALRILRHAILLAGTLLLCSGVNAYADDFADASRLYKQGQQNLALDKINSFLASKPKDAQGRFLKGLILTEQGKTADAIEIFSALTTDYPDLPEPYNNLAVLYAGKGEYEKARLALETAIRTHPSYATAHENLGDIYAKMASQAYDRALQLDRSNTATQTKLAMIQELFASGSRHKEPAPSKSSEASTPVTAAPVSTTTTVPAVNAATPENPPAAKDVSKDVVNTIDDWAAAWSAKDVDKYLSFYASDFTVPDGMSRAEWEAMRRDRISKPQHIQIGIKILTIQFPDDTHATAKFRQSYRASHLRTNGTKTLQLVRTDGKWLIQDERSR